MYEASKQKLTVRKYLALKIQPVYYNNTKNKCQDFFGPSYKKT